MNRPSFLERWYSSFSYEILDKNKAKSEKDETFQKLAFTFRTIPGIGTRYPLNKIYYRIHKQMSIINKRFSFPSQHSSRQ
jgi:hypothetical protein